MSFIHIEDVPRILVEYIALERSQCTHFYVGVEYISYYCIKRSEFSFHAGRNGLEGIIVGHSTVCPLRLRRSDFPFFLYVSETSEKHNNRKKSVIKNPIVFYSYSTAYAQ